MRIRRIEREIRSYDLEKKKKKEKNIYIYMNVAINGFLLARGRSSVFTRCNMFLRFVLLCAYKDYYDHCDYYDDGNFFRNSVSFPVSEAIFIVIMIIVI